MLYQEQQSPSAVKYFCYFYFWHCKHTCIACYISRTCFIRNNSRHQLWNTSTISISDIANILVSLSISCAQESGIGGTGCDAQQWWQVKHSVLSIRRVGEDTRIISSVLHTVIGAIITSTPQYCITIISLYLDLQRDRREWKKKQKILTIIAVDIKCQQK